jgi:hypothetical protein
MTYGTLTSIGDYHWHKKMLKIFFFAMGFALWPLFMQFFHNQLHCIIILKLKTWNIFRLLTLNFFLWSYFTFINEHITTFI